MRALASTDASHIHFTREPVMTRRNLFVSASAALGLVALSIGVAISAQDRFTVKVPGGLSFSEARGYETWQFINLSENGPVVATIFGNPIMIKAYKDGFPGNGKPIPDGAKMAKIHWKPTKNEKAPGAPTIGGDLLNVDVMVKDSKRFADSGGWGWAVFEYDAATDSFRPGDAKSTPPQGND